jgi:hypothetical protein
MSSQMGRMIDADSLCRWTRDRGIECYGVNGERYQALGEVCIEIEERAAQSEIRPAAQPATTGPADICHSCFDKDDCLFHRKGFRALQCPARKG